MWIDNGYLKAEKKQKGLFHYSMKEGLTKERMYKISKTEQWRCGVKNNKSVRFQ